MSNQDLAESKSSGQQQSYASSSVFNSENEIPVSASASNSVDNPPMREHEAYEDAIERECERMEKERERLERIRSSMRNEGPAEWQLLQPRKKYEFIEREVGSASSQKVRDTD